MLVKVSISGSQDPESFRALKCTHFPRKNGHKTRYEPGFKKQTNPIQAFRSMCNFSDRQYGFLVCIINLSNQCCSELPQPTLSRGATLVVLTDVCYF